MKRSVAVTGGPDYQRPRRAGYASRCRPSYPELRLVQGTLVPTPKLVAGDGPLLAVFALDHPVAAACARRPFQGFDGLAVLGGSRTNDAVSTPPRSLDVIVVGAEDVVAHRPWIAAVGVAHFPVAVLGDHGVSRSAGPRPASRPLFGDD